MAKKKCFIYISQISCLVPNYLILSSWVKSHISMVFLFSSTLYLSKEFRKVSITSSSFSQSPLDALGMSFTLGPDKIVFSLKTSNKMAPQLLRTFEIQIQIDQAGIQELQFQMSVFLLTLLVCFFRTSNQAGTSAI